MKEYHEEYLKIFTYKEKMDNYYQEIFNIDELSYYDHEVCDAKSYDDLSIIDKQFKIYKGIYGNSKSQNKILKPSRNNLYRKLPFYLEKKVDEIVKLFMPPLLQMCENILKSGIVDLPNPTSEPDDFYKQYIDDINFLSGLSVESACNDYLKLNLTNNFYLIKFARDHLARYGRYNTYPTELGAKEFQDCFHEFYGYHVFLNNILAYQRQTIKRI